MRGWWVGIAEMLLAHAALSSGVGRGFNRWGERSTDSAVFWAVIKPQACCAIRRPIAD